MRGDVTTWQSGHGCFRRSHGRVAALLETTRRKSPFGALATASAWTRIRGRLHVGRGSYTYCAEDILALSKVCKEDTVQQCGWCGIRLSAQMKLHRVSRSVPGMIAKLDTLFAVQNHGRLWSSASCTGSGGAARFGFAFCEARRSWKARGGRASARRGRVSGDGGHMRGCARRGRSNHKPGGNLLRQRSTVVRRRRSGAKHQTETPNMEVHRTRTCFPPSSSCP